jgi:putative Mg2+ transporter-C (MgtC) family protein
MLDIEPMLFEFLPKMLLAIFCGSLIGLERELKEKPAGMRTYMLICAGAALFTMVGVYFAEQWEGVSDPMRVAAQVVTGVGFLGAGTIIFARGHVKGLTSAAAIWMSAAVGMAIGIGMLVFSVLVTLVIILTLVLLGRIEHNLGLKGKKTYKFRAVIKKEATDQFLDMIKKGSSRLKITEMSTVGQNITVTLKCDLTRTERQKLQWALSKMSEEFSFELE